MKRLLYIVFGIMISATVVHAQESGVYTHYILNPVLLNPGATGFSNQHQFIFNYRNKWSNFDGAPRTYTFNYNGPVGDRMGIGGQLFGESIGKQRSFEGSVNWAYRFEADDFDFGAGLSVGMQQLRLASVADDPFIDDTDELLAQALDGVMLFDASFGLYGEYDDRLFFGLSFPDLVRTRLTDISGSIDTLDNKFNFALLLGYRFDIPEQNFTIEPSIAVKQIRRVPFHVDLNLKLSFLEEQLIGGVTYSVGEVSRIGVLLGTRIGDLRLFYSYDTSFGEFQQYNNGSHEFTVQYTLARKQKSAEAPADDM